MAKGCMRRLYLYLSCGKQRCGAASLGAIQIDTVTGWAGIAIPARLATLRNLDPSTHSSVL
jgi:hypothetical protein